MSRIGGAESTERLPRENGGRGSCAKDSSEVVIGEGLLGERMRGIGKACIGIQTSIGKETHGTGRKVVSVETYWTGRKEAIVGPRREKLWGWTGA